MKIIISNKSALDFPKKQCEKTSLNTMFLAAKIHGIKPKNSNYLKMLDRAIINRVKNN